MEASSLTPTQYAEFNKDLFSSVEEKNGKIYPQFNYDKITEEISDVISNYKAFERDGKKKEGFDLNNSLIFQLLKAKKLMDGDITEDLAKITKQFDEINEKKLNQKVKEVKRSQKDAPLDAEMMSADSVKGFGELENTQKKCNMFLLAFMSARELHDFDLENQIKSNPDVQQLDEFINPFDVNWTLKDIVNEFGVREKANLSQINQLFNRSMAKSVAEKILEKLVQPPDLKVSSISTQLREQKYSQQLIRDNLDEIVDHFITKLNASEKTDVQKKEIRQKFSEFLAVMDCLTPEIATILRE